jgi:hypothetical protein
VKVALTSSLLYRLLSSQQSFKLDTQDLPMISCRACFLEKHHTGKSMDAFLTGTLYSIGHSVSRDLDSVEKSTSTS